jgi:hypothetical protein
LVGRHAVAALLVCGAGSAAACGLTADFSGLQGGTRPSGEGGLVDAEAETEAEATALPPAEGGIVGAEAEGGEPQTDASHEVDAGYCASLGTPVQFCDDFDEGQAVGAGWDATDVYQGSNVLLDFTYYSPPASFLSEIDQNDSPASARLQKDLPIDTPHVHFEFEMLLPQVDGNFELCTLHEPVADGTTYGVFYKEQGGNLLVFVRTLVEDGGESDFTQNIGPPPSNWFHVTIDTDVSPSAHLVVTHDSTVVVDASNVNTSTLTRASMFVELGYYSATAASAIAHFDNVIVDWQ